MEKDMSFKHYFVRSQSMAGYLMWKKHKLLSLDPDRQYPQRNVFKFFNSPALLETIAAYKNLDK